MAMLGESWDNKQWLSDGNHVVKICEHRMFEYKTGSPGVEFVLKAPDGRQVKKSFCLHKNATWDLANFCKDIGLDRAAADSFDVLAAQSYAALIGKEVGVTVSKDGKYHEVSETNGTAVCVH